MVQVYHHKNQFEALNTQVLIIGFSKKRRVKGWLRQSEVTFPFLLDSQREVYGAYQLEHSFWRSWSWRNIRSYVKAFFKQGTLPQIEDDPNQLGADFIVDKQGRLRMTYYSPDPTYRPSVEKLLDTLRDIEQME